jgi:ATP-binding cassette subfamily B (MDR/TAP) protein 1
MAQNTEVDDHGKDNKSYQKVPFYKLFTFADSLDVTLMIIGTISAAANGMTQPIMTLILGKMINIFGSTDSHHIVKEVSKVFFFSPLYRD